MPVGEDAFDEGPPNNGRFRGRVVLEVFTPFGVGIALEVAERLIAFLCVYKQIQTTSKGNF